MPANGGKPGAWALLGIGSGLDIFGGHSVLYLASNLKQQTMPAYLAICSLLSLLVFSSMSVS